MDRVAQISLSLLGGEGRGASIRETRRRVRVARSIEMLINADFGRRRIDQVVRADVERALTDLKAGKTAVEPDKGSARPAAFRAVVRA